MTFEGVKDRYLLKIGQRIGAHEEDQDHLDRLLKAYTYLLQTTLCTISRPTLVSLSAVTQTTNAHDLLTALGVTGLMGVRRVFWRDRVPPRVPQWNKQAIEEANDSDSLYSGEPVAYAVWTSRSSNTDKWYMSFFPFISAANTTDCYITYLARPTMPTTLTWATVYPDFNDDYHDLIAEVAALDYLRDRGDARYTKVRILMVDDEVKRMKAFYNDQALTGERFGGFLESEYRGVLRHGEYVND